MKKKKRKPKRNLGGRPPKFTKELVKKLEEAFSMGCTYTEACLYVDISRNAYYEHCKKHAGFHDRMEELREHPTLKARINVARGIKKGERETSKWYLERKRKNEFSSKTEIGHGGANGKQEIVHTVKGALNELDGGSAGLPEANGAPERQALAAEQPILDQGQIGQEG